MQEKMLSQVMPLVFVLYRSFSGTGEMLNGREKFGTRAKQSLKQEVFMNAQACRFARDFHIVPLRKRDLL